MKCLYIPAAAIAATVVVQNTETAQPNQVGRSFVVGSNAVVQLRDIPGPVYVTNGSTNAVFLRIVPGPASDPPDIRIEHSHDRIAIYGDPLTDPEAVRSQVHLVVPPEVRFDVRNVRGELRVDAVIRGAVSMADVAGRVQLDEVSGSLTLLRIGGAVAAGVRGWGPVHIAQVGGSVALTIDAARDGRPMEIEGVSGSVKINVRK